MLVQVNISKFDELNFKKSMPRTKSNMGFGLFKNSRTGNPKMKSSSEMYSLNWPKFKIFAYPENCQFQDEQ